jgi:3-methylfumaryl-CoA hydratase
MSGLAEALRGWAPAPVEITRRVDAWAAEAVADLLDAPPPEATLPPLWHWFVLLEHPRQADLGDEGHPRAGSFLPPVPGRRRMFAGGRLRMAAPVPIGAELTGRSRVTDVAVKAGRSGELAFVTVRTDLVVDGVVVGVEEQDIVYRSEPPGTPPRTVERPPTGVPEPAGEWRAELTADPVLLFRFSALTYNAHRIHYDRPYAVDTEGYPDLVVHGPLLAILALELPRRRAPDRVVESIDYRLVRPAFVPAPLLATGRVTGAGVDVAVGARGAGASLTGRLGLVDGPRPQP